MNEHHVAPGMGDALHAELTRLQRIEAAAREVVRLEFEPLTRDPEAVSFRAVSLSHAIEKLRAFLAKGE